MKVKCIVSHEKILPEGKFQTFKAGEIYNLEKFNKKYFVPVETKKKGDKK